MLDSRQLRNYVKSKNTSSRPLRQIQFDKSDMFGLQLCNMQLPFLKVL